MTPNPNLQKAVVNETKRLLKLLATKSSSGFKINVVDEKVSICTDKHRFTFSQSTVEALSKQMAITQERDVLKITRHGLEVMRSKLGLTGAGFASFARSEKRVIDGCSTSVLVNQDESPLYRLHRRKTKAGQPYISILEYQAGERLRSDFERGQLQPRISARLEGNIGSSGKGSSFQAKDISDFALDARTRVHKALSRLGPELSGVAVDVCCFLKGLETVESERSWPPRSAKLMLRTGLQLLCNHYGIIGHANAREGMIQSWSTTDNRPNLL